MTRLARAILLAAFLAAGLATSLAACGKKGPPEVPAGQVDTLSKKYPRQE
jgi:predicted small lipoprotein YifL